ncbi:hypothetical protein ACTXT7_008462, partial [Hymenolepis weldensis]
ALIAWKMNGSNDYNLLYLQDDEYFKKSEEYANKLATESVMHSERLNVFGNQHASSVLLCNLLEDQVRSAMLIRTSFKITGSESGDLDFITNIR